MLAIPLVLTSNDAEGPNRKEGVGRKESLAIVSGENKE
jgi:hypothetical protein